MLITFVAKDLPRLDNLSCQAVTVHGVVLAVAGLNEFWTDAQKLQVALLFNRVGAQHFQKL